MARPTQALIDALIQTAARLRSGDTYQWSHMGACNCGHLAQTVTKISRAELHAMALERAGDWSEQAVEFCPTSGLPIDHVIATMLELGLTRDDLAHLERLSSPYVLAKLPQRRYLNYAQREDVVLYLETWARALAEELRAGLTVLTTHAASGVAATDSPAIEDSEGLDPASAAVVAAKVAA